MSNKTSIQSDTKAPNKLVMIVQCNADEFERQMQAMYLEGYFDNTLGVAMVEDEEVVGAGDLNTGNQHALFVRPQQGRSPRLIDYVIWRATHDGRSLVTIRSGFVYHDKGLDAGPYDECLQQDIENGLCDAGFDYEIVGFEYYAEAKANE